MKEWLLSVTAVVLLSVLLELLLTEGKIKKYVSGVIRLVVIVVVFVPVIKFVKSDFDWMDIFPQTEVSQTVVDENTLAFIDGMKREEAEKEVENKLSSVGIKDADVNIYTYDDGEKITISYISVDLYAAVITGYEENIILTEKIKETVGEILTVSEDKIIIYGGV